MELVAGIGGLGSLEEGGGVVLRAGGVGEKVGGVVEADLDDTGRGDKIFRVGIFRQLHRVFHEVGKDGTGGAGPFRVGTELGLDVGVIVVCRSRRCRADCL